MKNITIILIFSLIIALIFMIPTISSAKDTIYQQPAINSSTTDKDGLDDMIKDAEKFENREAEDVIFVPNQSDIQSFSSSLYSVLVIAATAVTVVVGIVLGVKYMIGSVEAKAQYKKLLVPYVAGCIAIYGALGIWKILVTILGSV